MTTSSATHFAIPFVAVSLSFFFTLALTPLVLSISSRLQLFDSLGPLKIHVRPIPRTGGIALGLGLLTGVFFSLHGREALPINVLASGTALWLTGILDDLFGLSVPIRLAAQIFAASLLCLDGYRPPFLPSWGCVLVLIVFALVAINAFNFLDGSDGLATSVALVIAAAFAAAFLFSRYSLLPGIAIASSLLGACAAFLLFNLPPARIFLGDSGSTLLGYAFALLALEFVGNQAAERTSFSALFYPLFAGAVPLLDFFFAILRRWRRGQSIHSGDRNHFYDLLLARGWTPRRVALSSAAATAVLCFVGFAAFQLKAIFAAGIFVVWFLLLSVCGFRLGIARSEEKVAATRASEEKLSTIVS